MRFLNRWRMPLIFVVSGAAIALALGSRSPKTFALDRVRRLLVPLVLRHGRDRAAADLSRAAVSRPVHRLVLRLAAAGLQGGAYPNGNMSWHHLWFLAYVLVLTLVLLPYFLWARSARGQAALARPGRPTARFGLQWLMVLPLAALDPVAGADLLQHQRPDRRLARPGLLRRRCCSAAPSCSARRTCWRHSTGNAGCRSPSASWPMARSTSSSSKARCGPTITDAVRPAFALLSAINTMAWLFAIIGFANRHLTKRPAFLDRRAPKPSIRSTSCTRRSP